MHVMLARDCDPNGVWMKQAVGRRRTPETGPKTRAGRAKVGTGSGPRDTL